LTGTEEVSFPVHPNDPALRLGPVPRPRYIEIGLSAVECIERVIDGEPKSILDFGCGYGRVMRAIRDRFPTATLTAYDINEEGVEFCSESFDARAVYKLEELDEHEVVWCGSVLTHLDAPRWETLLPQLEQLAQTLIFTTDGRYVAELARGGERQGFRYEVIQEVLAVYDATGFGYRDYRRDQPGYGLTLVKPSWVCLAIEKWTSLELKSFSERAWGGRQDVVAAH
jgi:SAM-dependent methyltransferase